MLRQTTVVAAAAPLPPKPIAVDMIHQWALDPSIAFMNHGCFGARPRAVLQAQAKLREQYESRPIEFLDRKRTAMIADARAGLGRFVGAGPDDLGFVTNATGGIAAVLRSLDFRADDELV